MKTGKKSAWKVTDIPSQMGKNVIITGTAGIGYETSLVLARAGAEITIAGRDKTKGEQAVLKLKSEVPAADVSFEILDLANMESIKQFGKRMRSEGRHVDVLINNAAIMTPPKRLETVDGFESQFGTNYIGPFLLTSELLPLLRNAEKPLVVTVCSVANRYAKIDFSDLQSKKAYKPMAAYGQSKLANLLFAIELERRSLIENWGITSIAVHPGVANTNLTIATANPNGLGSKFKKALISILAKPAAEGAWPTLFAITSPTAVGGEYYGPSGFQEIRGTPAAAKIPRVAHDAMLAEQLWHTTEQLIGERFNSMILPASSLASSKSP